jgi:hypothetical protein
VTLELSKVTSQVAQLGEQAAQRRQRFQAVVPDLVRTLTEYAADADLRRLVEEAVRNGWTGGVPADESLDAAIDPIGLPERVTIVAADGSQIYPDRHGIALYYVINIGSLILRLGSSEAPIAEAAPEVYYDEQQLYDDDENLITAQLINARRTVMEMTTLTRLACEEIRQAPTVALSDGNIALRVKQEGIPERERQRLQDQYLAQLHRLRGSQVIVGSFISRPSATSVVRLLHLAQTCPFDRVAEYVKNRVRPYDGITDTPIFLALLKPTQRSAIFKQVTQWAKPYEEAEHAIHFFYVNVSTPDRRVVVRVEMPEWVAADTEKVNLLHAVVVDQCRVTSIPYPYVLTRADEMAVITTVEKTNLEQMIAMEMVKRDVEATPSEKAATKTIARYGKRR